MKENKKEQNDTGDNKKFQIPWWLYLLFAVCSYSFLQYLVPAIFTNQPQLESFVHLAKQAAPIVAIVFLLPAAHALYQNDTPDSAPTNSEKNN